MGIVRRHPVLAALALLILLVIGIVTATGVAVWRSAHTDEASRIDHADLIAVLGAAQYDGRPSPVFEARLEHAKLLYDRQFAPRIVVLGGGRPGDNTTEADAGRRWLIDAGVPEDRVFAQPVGSTTAASMRGAAQFMRERDLDTVFLVSDPWHNLRIRRMARDLGMEAFVSATFRSAARSQWTRSSGYLRETFAYLYYRVFGG